jgi:hypothetical protein
MSREKGYAILEGRSGRFFGLSELICRAGMAELADAADSKSSGQIQAVI